MKNIKSSDIDFLLAETTKENWSNSIKKDNDNNSKNLTITSSHKKQFMQFGHKYALKEDLAFGRFSDIIDECPSYSPEIWDYVNLISKYFKIIDNALWLFFPEGTVFTYAGPNRIMGYDFEVDEYLVPHVFFNKFSGPEEMFEKVD